MQIDRFCYGYVSANSYLIYDDEGKKGSIIDPSFYPEKMIKYIDDLGIELESIYLTHGHFDHIAGVNEVQKKFGCKLFISKEDEPMIYDPVKNLSSEMHSNIVCNRADGYLSDKSLVNIAGTDFLVISTPGHTAGSICFASENVIFTGDTLFNLSIGRTDFPGGDYPAMEESLKKLIRIEKDLVIYPGHGNASSLFYEKENNPFLNNL